MPLLHPYTYAFDMERRPPVTSPLSIEIKTPEQAREKRCQHHWLIEQAAGPTSLGRCQRCGAERDFYNDPEAARLVQPVTS
jgi:hypothetical protein